MDVPIHYARTADDCAIAYTVSGAGPPLVYLQPYSHQQIDQQHPVIGRWYDHLAAQNTLVRLDARGFGLSSRDASKLSIVNQVTDVEAVVDRLGLEQFPLAGISGQGFTATLYAARNPHRVSRLLIWGTPAAGFRGRTSSTAALVRLDDPGLALDAQARWVSGEELGEIVAWREYLQSTISVDALGVYLDELVRTDITSELAEVLCPSVVVHPTLHAHLPLADTQDVASRLSQSEFVMAESRVYPHLGPDIEGNLRIFERFLGHPAEPPAASPLFLAGDTGASESADGQRTDAEVLSTRELEVLALIAAGKTNPEIAEALTIAPATASRHVHNILEKLGMSRRSEAAAWWARNGNSGGHQ
ncbi:MAG: alpha/beta fold hydrolase [Tepidiformaceae bacterium]